MADGNDSVSDTEASDAADRAAFLAEMSGGKPSDASADQKATVEASGDEESAESSETDDTVSGDADGEAETEESEPSEDESNSDDDDESDDESDKTPDSDRDKRLAAVQKAERRSKEQVAKWKQDATAEIDAARTKLETEWGPRIKAAERFESLSGRIKYDLVGVVRELGLSEDDFEAAAYELHANSKAASAKPEHKAAATAAARAREQADKLAKLEREQDELKKQIAKRDADAAASKQAEAYIATVVKAIDEKTAPLAKHFLAKNPEKVRQRLAQAAYELYEANGTEPSPKAVLKRYEATRREELEELGVDIAGLLKTAPTKANGNRISGKPKIEVVDKSKVKKVANGNNEPRVLSDEEEREEILRELAQMRSSSD